MDSIRLPDGTEISAFSVGAMRTVGGVQYPERDLFKKSVKVALGIKEVIRTAETIDRKYYQITGETESEEIVDGVAVVTVTPTVGRLLSVTELAKELGGVIEKTMRALYKANKAYYDELTDDQSPIYDLSNPYVPLFESYRGDLKTAYQQMKSDVNDIRNSGLTDDEKYSAILAYDWAAVLPVQPLDSL